MKYTNEEYDITITEIKEEQNLKEFVLNNRMKYTNEEYDITIIEIKPEDNINIMIT